MNKNYPLVSVVIPAFNEEKFLGKTLESLAVQDYLGKYEVILVDNASTDNTREAALKFGVKVVHEPRKGVHFARQTGFEKASGDLIASTDADNVLPVDWLTMLVDEINSDSELVALGGWFKINQGSLTLKFFINFLSPCLSRLYTIVTGKDVLIGQNFIVRKEIFFKTGGFLNLSGMQEDLLLAQRLSMAGKVKMNYGSKWKVATSPRRWKNGLLPGSFRYVINGISFALCNRLVFKSFINVREEKKNLYLQPLCFALTFMIFLALFLTLPKVSVNAKLAPVAKKVEKQITATINQTKQAIPTQTILESLK